MSNLKSYNDSRKRFFSHMEKMKKFSKDTTLFSFPIHGKTYIDILHIPAITKKPKHSLIWINSGDGFFGDEALNIFLKKNKRKLNYKENEFFIIHTTNPTGMEQNTSNNINNVDLNKDFTSENPQVETEIVESFLTKAFQDQPQITLLNFFEDKRDPEDLAFSMLEKSKMEFDHTSKKLITAKYIDNSESLKFLENLAEISKVDDFCAIEIIKTSEFFQKPIKCRNVEKYQRYVQSEVAKYAEEILKNREIL
ncbi:MAG: DUF2817 domain-containing protein [Spirochaetales bacterium]|nr:DUF2817 domain-containing protein [Spirochaetales bacterium]